MFSALAPRYQLFNRWSSLGLDGRWRTALVNELRDSHRVLDLGTGTGDLACGIAQQRPGTFVLGADLSFDMMVLGKRVVSTQAPVWVQASGEALPFRGASFDSVVSAFVLRNLFMGGVLAASLRESSRILGAGGRLIFLDLTRPTNVLVRWGHGIYGKTALPLIGRLMFGKNWPGAYLAGSIQALPSGETLGKLFMENGFSSYECRPLWGGIVSLFIGKK